MAGKIEYGALVTQLQNLVSNKYNGSSLRAFQSNHAFNPADTAATYLAIECTFTGYASITLNAWGSAYLNSANKAECDETVRSWIAGGAGLPQTVYGIFVLDASGNLLYSELFSGGGVSLVASGDQCNYQPRLTLESKF
jgi:hypothetical protein